ncbi:hypothetical protein DY000_02021001 [Brassica cretica]|uniref:Uncharacterized protein n=1 Tax=Brassica cretica TaxID=69181 RepID=A0ABQ7EEF3_BRACR|nr:hypothetical protein DY000_02021001 [Brassica cretica]
MFSACSSSYLSSSEVELDAFIGEGRPIDPSCFTSSLKIEFVCLSIQTRELFLLNAGRICADQTSLRFRNVCIVRWKARDHLEFLGGLIVFVAWAVICDFRSVPWALECFA